MRALSILLFWLRGTLLLRAFQNMSALLLMVEEIIRDTRDSIILLSIFICATAHAWVGGGYLPPNYLAVFFRTVGIGVHGEAIPEEFLPDESLPDATGSGALVLKIVIFLLCLYLVNIVMMNFLIASMGDTFERVTEQKEILALRNKAELLLEVNSYFPSWMNGRSNFLLVCVTVNEAVRWSSWAGNAVDQWRGYSGDVKRELRAMQAQFEKSLEVQFREQQKSLQAQLEKFKEDLRIQ